MIHVYTFPLASIRDLGQVVGQHDVVPMELHVYTTTAMQVPVREFVKYIAPTACAGCLHSKGLYLRSRARTELAALEDSRPHTYAIVREPFTRKFLVTKPRYGQLKASRVSKKYEQEGCLASESGRAALYQLNHAPKPLPRARATDLVDCITGLFVPRHCDAESISQSSSQARRCCSVLHICRVTTPDTSSRADVDDLVGTEQHPLHGGVRGGRSGRYRAASAPWRSERCR
ncbi:hypothetical protein GGR56DRAFT_545793 [Xylariaceae sp. FL0804]|nr:hypothetical protein GGR56DRAFT_545793 [Xylariaceae sp. FL0804]